LGIGKSASTEELGYSIDKYDESPRIYNENLGEVILINTQWKTSELERHGQGIVKTRTVYRSLKEIMFDNRNQKLSRLYSL
jgi:hypothetical protein